MLRSNRLPYLFITRRVLYRHIMPYMQAFSFGYRTKIMLVSFDLPVISLIVISHCFRLLDVQHRHAHIRLSYL